MTQQRRGPIPATHAGQCSVCGKWRKVSPADNKVWLHRCLDGWRRRRPVPGSLTPIPGRQP